MKQSVLMFIYLFSLTNTSFLIFREYCRKVVVVMIELPRYTPWPRIFLTDSRFEKSGRSSFHIQVVYNPFNSGVEQCEVTFCIYCDTLGKGYRENQFLFYKNAVWKPSITFQVLREKVINYPCDEAGNVYLSTSFRNAKIAMLSSLIGYYPLNYSSGYSIFHFLFLHNLCNWNVLNSGRSVESKENHSTSN